MAAEPNEATPPELTSAETERALREAEARALAESGLGSGLLRRQSQEATEASVAVLKICPQCGREYETTSRFCPEDGTALRPKGSDSLIGRTLAERYHILKRIGEGGMGRVYLGEHVKMNRQCAIKVMSPALVNDADSAARFAREASNAARIIHPNVAAVFDFGESEGVVYLVMEYVEGEPLSRILVREAPFSLQRAVDITKQIADGLGAAHELGIIHRDLKPDNILITRTRAGKEIAKVVDFGIAKAVQENANEGLTRTGQVIGTPEFMAPEQLYGDNVDVRSDLYALGCILHLMLTAQPPFEAPTREQMIKRRLAEEPGNVQTIDPGIPDVVANVVSRLLARSPSDRYGSATEVKDALDGHLARRTGFESRPSLSLRYTPRSAPTVAFLHATQATTEVTEVPIAPAQVKGRTPFLIGGIAVIGIAAAALFFTNSQSPVLAEHAASVSRDSSLATVHPESLGALVIPTRDSAKADSAKPVAVAPKVPVVDSAKLKAAHLRDSLSKVQSGLEDAARATVARYARALESREVTSLSAVYPGMSEAQQKNWRETYFEKMERIDTKVTYGETRVSGDSASVDFSLKLDMVRKDNKQPLAPIVLGHQRARLVKKDGGWQIAQIVQQ